MKRFLYMLYEGFNNFILKMFSDDRIHPDISTKSGIIKSSTANMNRDNQLVIFMVILAAIFAFHFNFKC